MPVVNYYSMNGRLVGEKTAGSERIDYLPDALGNVSATLNQSGQVVNTYRYKPYGAQLAKTGVGADPAFQWVGQHGYRKTEKKWSDVYVRARHYDSGAGRWTTKDPLVFEEGLNRYLYVMSEPVGRYDPSGLVCEADYADVNPATKCWTVAERGETCDNSCKTSQNFSKLHDLLKQFLTPCFDKNTPRGQNLRRNFATFMTCIAQAESALDCRCANWSLESGQNLGLFQLDQNHFNACKTKKELPCQSFSGQADAAVHLVVSLCRNHRNSYAYDRLMAFWGVLRPTDRAFGKFTQCILSHGLTASLVRALPCIGPYSHQFAGCTGCPRQWS